MASLSSQEHILQLLLRVQDVHASLVERLHAERALCSALTMGREVAGAFDLLQVAEDGGSPLAARQLALIVVRRLLFSQSLDIAAMREDTIYDAESRGSWDRNFPEDAKRFIADASLRLLSAPELPIRNASIQLVAKLFSRGSEEIQAHVFNFLVPLFIADRYPYVLTVAECFVDIFEESNFSTQCNLFVALLPVATRYLHQRMPDFPDGARQLTHVVRLARVMVHDISNVSLSVGYDGLPTHASIVSALKDWIETCSRWIGEVALHVKSIHLNGALIEIFRSMASAIRAFPADLGIRSIDEATNLCCCISEGHLAIFTSGSSGYSSFSGNDNYSSDMLILESLGTLECAISACDASSVQNLEIIQNSAKFHRLLELLFEYSRFTKSDVCRWETESLDFWVEEQNCEEIDDVDVAGASPRVLTRNIVISLFKVLKNCALQYELLEQYQYISSFMIDRARLILSRPYDAETLLSVEASLWHLQGLGKSFIASSSRKAGKLEPFEELFLDTLRTVVIPCATSLENRNLLLKSRASLLLADYLDDCPMDSAESALTAIVEFSLGESHIGFKLSLCKFIRAAHLNRGLKVRMRDVLAPFASAYLADTARLLGRLSDHSEEGVADLPIFSLFAVLSAITIASDAGIRPILCAKDAEDCLGCIRTESSIPPETLSVVVEALLRTWSRTVFDEITIDSIVATLRICLLRDAIVSSFEIFRAHFYPFVHGYLESFIRNSLNCLPVVHESITGLLLEIVIVNQYVTQKIMQAQGPEYASPLMQPILGVVNSIYPVLGSLASTEVKMIASKLLTGIIVCISDELIHYFLRDVSLNQFAQLFSKLTSTLKIDSQSNEVIASALGLEAAVIIKFQYGNGSVELDDFRSVILKSLQLFVALKRSDRIEAANISLLQLVHFCARHSQIVFDILLHSSRLLDGSACSRLASPLNYADSALEPFVNEWISMHSGILRSHRYSLAISSMALVELVNWTVSKAQRLECLSHAVSAIIESLPYLSDDFDERDDLAEEWDDDHGEWIEEESGDHDTEWCRGDDDTFDGDDVNLLEPEVSGSGAVTYDLSDMLDQQKVTLHNKSKRVPMELGLIDTFIFRKSPMQQDKLVAHTDNVAFICNSLKHWVDIHSQSRTGNDFNGSLLSEGKLKEYMLFQQLTEDQLRTLRTYGIIGSTTN